MPNIELGAGFQGKFDLKGRDEVSKDGRFKVVPYRHCSSFAFYVEFFKLWCPVTSALLDCRSFPARNFFSKRY